MSRCVEHPWEQEGPWDVGSALSNTAGPGVLTWGAGGGSTPDSAAAGGAITGGGLGEGRSVTCEPFLNSTDSVPLI